MDRGTLLFNVNAGVLIGIELSVVLIKIRWYVGHKDGPKQSFTFKSHFDEAGWRTFHRSFEEDFAAPAGDNAVVTSGRLVPTHQAHLGCGGRVPQRRAAMRTHKTPHLTLGGQEMDKQQKQQ